MLLQLLLCHAAALLCAAGATTTGATTAPRDGPVTISPTGTFLGSWMATRRGRRIQAYRGIRYAEPPVGPLRFQPPRPIKRYTELVNASEDGPACPLPAPPTYYVDEDCLRLNVYTPDNKSKKLLPVIFYIHPGGFYSMTGRSDLAGPQYLLDKDTVLVSINYRIGSLGFMSTGDKLAPGNNGMKDQVIALRWVQKNIAAFGGDPNLVTITGCSAGSISVMLHMISPMSKGLFHRGISMSAAPVGKEPYLPHQDYLAIKQAELLNCPTGSSKEIVDCLMTKPWKELGDSLPGFFEYGYDPVGLWGPVVEPDFGQERFLDIDPVVAIRQGKMHTVPYIISQTTEEFSWFSYVTLRNETLLKGMNEEWDRRAPISFLLPRNSSRAYGGKPTQYVVDKIREVYLNNTPLVNDEASARGLGNIYADSVIAFGVNRLVHLMALYSKHPVWYTEFAYFGESSHYEDPVTKKPTGAMHHDDTLYVLYQSYRFPMIQTTSPDSHTVDRLTAIWYNFARYGNPNPKGDTPELGALSWPPVKPDRRCYLRVGDTLTLGQNLKEDRLKFWEEMYPMLY